jgi:hypothetical protein
MSQTFESNQSPIYLKKDTDSYTFHVNLISVPVGLQREDLLRIIFSDQGPILYLFINKIQPNNRGLTASGKVAFWFLYDTTASPPVTSMATEDDDCPNLVPMDKAEGKSWLESRPDTCSPPSLLRADRLRFEILVWRRGRLDQRIGNLTFSKLHPRFWANLPSDEDLFRLSQGRKLKHFEPEMERLRQQANSPRFHLSGPETDDLRDYYLPIHMPQTVAKSYRSSKAALVAKELSPKERDGVDHFDASLFIDEDLRQVGIGMLLQEAEYKHYTRPNPQPLEGIHSLLPVDEVTLIAVPDAIHRSWSLDAEPVPAPLAAPILAPVSGPDTFNRYTVSWSEVPGATRYLVQRSDTPDFPEPSNHFVERPVIRKFEQPYPSSAMPNTDLKVTLPFKYARSQYFRVRSERYGEISTWSNTRGQMLPPQDFAHCDTPRPACLELNLALASIGSPADGFLLSWEAVSEDGGCSQTVDKYELQLASDSGFLSAQGQSIENKNHFVASVPIDAVIYYRVRAWRSETAGPWSNTVRIAPEFFSTHTLHPIIDYSGEQLLTIHRALIRFCAARRDLLAVLSLPRHYRYQDVLDHVRALRATGSTAPFTPMNAGENELSYAALYHPWFASNSETAKGNGTRPGGIRYYPPEGAIIGTMATFALNEGAWLAPANQPLVGPLALDPNFTLEQWGQLSTAGVNIIRQDPRGFMVLNAETLSAQNEFRLINVRRLMSLLNRLALREGNRYLFESNDSEFRDAIQHQFDKILSDMYIRGAFAGITPDAGFRVVTDDSVNTSSDIDRGRFIVELQVAPSKPLSFLTIRLIQTGPGQLEVQEF